MDSAVGFIEGVLSDHGLAVALVFLLIALIGFIVKWFVSYLKEMGVKFDESLTQIISNHGTERAEWRDEHQKERELWREDSKETKEDIVRALNHLEAAIDRRK